MSDTEGYISEMLATWLNRPKKAPDDTLNTLFTYNETKFLVWFAEDEGVVRALLWFPHSLLISENAANVLFREVESKIEEKFKRSIRLVLHREGKVSGVSSIDQKKSGEDMAALLRICALTTQLFEVVDGAGGKWNDHLLTLALTPLTAEITFH